MGTQAAIGCSTVFPQVLAGVELDLSGYSRCPMTWRGVIWCGQ
jgi:hypothetical protein